MSPSGRPTTSCCRARGSSRRRPQPGRPWPGEAAGRRMVRLDARACGPPPQLESLRSAGHGTDRRLHISVSPARRLDPETVRGYADLGVDRLIVVPPAGLPLAELESDSWRTTPPERLGVRLLGA